MEIRFKPRPMALDYRCFMCGRKPDVGFRLKAGFIRPGRPEIVRVILLVDNDQRVLTDAKINLEKYGFRVLTVDPARGIKEHAFSLIEEHKPEMIIMDGIMPDIKGSELIKELREGKSYSGYIVGNSISSRETCAMLREGADFTIMDNNMFDLLNHFDI